MFKKQTLQLSQSHLDKRIRKMNQVGIMSTPPRGWIYTIRTTLGMTLAQLGKRLGVSPQAIAQLEKREVDGQITLSTLRAALRALGVESTRCHLSCHSRGDHPETSGEEGTRDSPTYFADYDTRKSEKFG